MTGDNKNFIMAMALSVGIILAWNFFYAQPQLEQQRAKQEIEAQNKKVNPDAEIPRVTNQGAASTPSGDIPGTRRPRDVVLAESERITIDTALLEGSVNLKGARIDDLKLRGYHVTVDKDSPLITLLSPSGSPGAFYAEQGWTPGAGAKVKVPGTDTVWKVSSGRKLTTTTPLVLTWDNGEGLQFRRTISVDDGYMFSVKQEVTNSTGAAVALYPYARVQRQEMPEITGIYVLHEGLIGVLDEKLEEITYDSVKDDPTPRQFDTTGGWVGITDKYWAVALVPDQKQPISARFLYRNASGTDLFQSDYLSKNGVTIAPGATGGFQSEVFAGAKVVNKINAYQEKFNIVRFDRMIDWGWFPYLTKPLFWLLDKINELVANFGVAILIVTVIVKLVFFPLANKSYKSMAQMKKLQPEMMKIKERFGDDRVKQQQAMMELYKKEKVSPLSGCLPILVQIPVFFALYKVIYITIELRHAPFYGWIKDLSAQDPTSIFNLFGLIPWEPPSFLLIGVLPLIMGITMWIQMRLNPAPPDPIQAKIFMWMPLFFTVILAPFPAGLVLYWAWNNFLSILQQYTIMKRQGADVDLVGNIKEAFEQMFGKRSKE